MRFGEPTILWGLLLVPVLWLFLLTAERLKARALRIFGNPSLFLALTSSYSPSRARWKRVLSLAAVFLIILSLARPQWGGKLVEVKRRGIDVILAVDVSFSMLTEDVLPSRLERAKLEATDFIKRLQGDRIGIVSFSGGAFISCPLTLDYRAAQLFVDNLQAGMISKAGTNLAEAINTSVLAFNQKDKRGRVLVLFTDGEDQGNAPQDAAQWASDQGAKIFCIGIGTPSGEPIPMRDAQGKFTGHKKDENGQPVVSRLDEGTLAQIAQIGKGKYMALARSDYDLDKLQAEIAGLEKKELEGTLTVEYQDRYQYFILLAVLLLAVDLFMTDRRKDRSFKTSPSPKIPTAVSVLFLFLFVFSVTARGDSPGSLNRQGNKTFQQGDFEKAAKLYEEAAVEKPEEFALQYNLANALQKGNDYAQALQAYQRSIQMGDFRELSLAYYNLGNALYGLEQYQEALLSYRKALELSPSDREAKFNYEMTLKKLQEQARNQKQNKKDKNTQDQKSKKDQNKSSGDKENKPQKPDQPSHDRDKPEDKKNQQQNSPQADKPKLNQEEAERILEALAQKEKDKNMQKQKERQKVLMRRNAGRDW